MLTETTTPDANDAAVAEGWWHAPGGLREALATASPLMVSTLSWTVMNFIDRLFLLWYSPDAVAAALPAGVWVFTVICFPLGVASYASTFVAQYYGAERRSRIGPVVWQALWIGVAAVPWAIAFVPLAPWFFEQGGNPPAIVEYEVVYFRSLSYSGGAMVLSGALSAFFTGQGRMRVVMVVDILAAAVNVVLDYLWIFGIAGFPEWGVAGAGWATTVALWFKAIVYLWLFLRPRERDEFATWTGRGLDGALLRRLFRFGAVSGLQMVLECGAFAMFVLLVGRLGTEALAATSLAFNVNNFAFMPVYGVGMAASTMVGRRLGEDAPELAARSTWSALVCGLVYMATVCATYVLLPEFVLAAHQAQGDPDEFAKLRETTIVLLRFVASFGLLDAVGIILSGALKGAGDVRFVLVGSISIAAAGVAATWLGLHFGLGLVWCWSVLTAWVLALAFAFVWRFLHGRWRTMRVIEPEADA
jgi:MATE family multidrug resistance protein